MRPSSSWIDTLITVIAQSSQEQASSLSQVNSAVNQMDHATQKNVAMVEQTTTAAANLRTEAAQLADRIAQFQTGEAVTARAPQARRMARAS